MYYGQILMQWQDNNLRYNKRWLKFMRYTGISAKESGENLDHS